MDNLMLKFPHLSEQIFQKLKLNYESLLKSREVARLWKYLINERNYLWIHVVNIPTVLKDNNTYLHLAAKTGKIDAFKTALNEEEDKNIKNIFHYTAFHYASQYGQLQIVELLLKNTDLNIDFNAKDTSGLTALIFACYNGHSDVVKIIMESSISLGIDLNAQEIVSGNTAFNAACERGYSDVVKIFMKNAAILNIDLSAKNFKGFTGFHLACQRGFVDMVKLFMENATILSIDLNAKDKKFGWTGFHWACWEGPSEGYKPLDPQDVQDTVKIFMENRAIVDLNLKDNKNRTAFHIACEVGNFNLVKMFMENSATFPFKIFGLQMKNRIDHKTEPL